MATNTTQSADERFTTDLCDRDVRALSECMTVMEYDGDGLFSVVTESGSSYLVDAETESCDCPDARHRDNKCKHIRRVAFATGDRPVPAWVDMDGVDELLGEQTDGPRIAMADGGMFRDAVRGRFETERVDGGALVFDAGGDDLGRELVGFSHPDGVDCIRWDKIRDVLVSRGVGVGAIHHKEQFEPQEVGL